VATLALATACGRITSETAQTTLIPTPGATTSDLPSYRATPFSQSPAAGICGSMNGDLITVTIYPDIPNPRCVEARPEQRLKVVNQTSGPLHVAIGLFQADIEPDENYTFDKAVGEYLAPGVHLIQVSPCCSPELWLK
jgi:hypothetical protein